jgi:hypothetical protein
MDFRLFALQGLVSIRLLRWSMNSYLAPASVGYLRAIRHALLDGIVL